MKPKHIYIQPETDAALSKLGGANRAENLRRAVALAECADELAEAAIALIIAEYDETGSLMESLINAVDQYETVRYGEAKQ